MEIVKFFLDQGMDINARDETNRPPLTSAIEGQNEETVELLCQRGADVNAVFNYGEIYSITNRHEWERFTALHLAAKMGNDTITKILLRYGSDTNIKTKSLGIKDFTPFQIACGRGHLNVVQVLMGHGALVSDLQKHDGKSIVRAAEKGQEDIVKFLLDSGSFPWIALHSALSFASMEGHIGTVEILLKAGGSIEYALCTAVQYRKIKLLKWLLDKGVSVNCFYNSKTPLHNALSYNSGSGIVKLLLSAGADINIRGENSIPTIHYAMKGSNICFPSQIEDNIKVMEILLNHGAEVNETDSNGTMILHLDKHELLQGFECNVEILIYLIKRGANFNATDSEGKTVVQRRNKNDAKLLLKTILHEKYLNGVSISRNILQFVQQDNELNAFFALCKNEVENMKSIALNGTAVTLFDIFTTANMNQLTAYARNDKIVKYFGDKRFQNKFPQFSQLIEEHFQPALYRQKFLDKGKSKLFGGKLPVICSDLILSHLGIDDLISLSEA